MKKQYEIAEYHRLMLEIAPPFDGLTLKKSYHKLIGKWHPDRNNESPEKHFEATEKSKVINLAYEYLSELLEENGGTYFSIEPLDTSEKWDWSEIQPKRRYEGKSYTSGFPDTQVIEIFLKSSHIISVGYNEKSKRLYIKFSGNIVYCYFDVPVFIYNSLLAADSHGKYCHSYIYKKYRYTRF
jgi:hypothetical protein